MRCLLWKNNLKIDKLKIYLIKNIIKFEFNKLMMGNKSSKNGFSKNYSKWTKQKD